MVEVGSEKVVGRKSVSGRELRLWEGERSEVKRTFRAASKRSVSRTAK